MINTVKNIYNSEDLTGEFLLRPLKTYHNFFARKIENSLCLKKVAWLIANVVSGIFAYPVLGVLAGIGILVKLIGISDIKIHNQSQKNSFENIELGIKHSAVFTNNSSSTVTQSGWKMTAIREFKITKQNIDALSTSIKQEIDSFSDQYRKVYISSQGQIIHGIGEIILQIRIRERV